MSDGALWLVRHGHTVAHAAGTIAGRRDVALDGRGREALARLGGSAEGALGARVLAARWFASPRLRTRESAAILRDALERARPLGAGIRAGGAAPTPDARLVELDFGAWEGSTWDAVHRDDAAALAAWGEDWVSRSPPGGESFAELAARVASWCEEHLPGDVPADPPRRHDTLVVAHAGSIRALLCRLLGRPLEEAMRFSIDPASLCRLERDARRRGGWRLAALNLPRFG